MKTKLTIYLVSGHTLSFKFNRKQEEKVAEILETLKTVVQNGNLTGSFYFNGTRVSVSSIIGYNVTKTWFLV